MRNRLVYEYRFPFAKYPAVRVVLIVVAGIVAGSQNLTSAWGPALWIYLLSAGCLLQVALETLNRVRVSVSLSYACRSWYLLLLVIFGCTLWEVRNTGPPEELIILEGLDGFQTQITGLVLGVRKYESGRITADIAIDSILVEGRFMALNVRIQAGSFRTRPELDTLLRMNHYVGMSVRFRGLPSKRNPNAFDVRAWLLRAGIHSTANIESVSESHFVENPLSWVWWKAKLDTKLEESVDENARPLLKAILLGDKGGMNPETRTAFSRAGLSHLMAVSGMHVGFVLMPIWILIPWFWTHKAGRSLGLLLIAGILFFYAGITGFSASVSRASITACLLAIGKLFQRNRDSLNTTGVAALFLLLYDPESLYDIGFQLSFAAVTVILLLGPVIRNLIPAHIRYGWKGNVIQFVGISMVVQTGLFTLLVVTFGEFSVAGPIANTIGVPVTQLLFLWSMVALPVSFIYAPLGAYLLIPVEWMAWVLIQTAEVVGNWQYSWIAVTKTSPLIHLVWVAGVGMFACIQTPVIRWKWVIALLAVLCMVQSHELYLASREKVLRVTVFDVGQGDAILIETPSGKNILYDTGILSPFQNSGKSVILPELKARGIRHLDAVILSHPHADHIGGMLSILESTSVGVIYQPAFTYNSAVFAGYMELARRKKVPVVEVVAGMEVSPDKAMRILILNPVDRPLGRDPNAHSVVAKLVFGETSFLLTGDAEQVAERYLVEYYGDMLRSDWMKAGHHGSKTSSDFHFLEKVSPEVVAVSLGLSNRYRHPHQEAARRLLSTGAEVHFTSLKGALVYESNGVAIRQKVWQKK